MTDQIVGGRAAAYRAASEALHRGDPSWVRRAAHYRMLRESGLEALIRTDFYALFEFPEGASGELLDAGCGAGGDTAQLARRAPGLSIRGVDVSAVALGPAMEAGAENRIHFHQAVLERLPFASGVFDYVAAHEVIEHVEDPVAVAGELARVLKTGGICVVATPNGASLWIEHLRQRVMRALGKRGAPVGADHTRTSHFWRGTFAAVGLVVEKEIYDGSALEFQLFIAPAKWMPALSRLYEPLRAVPLVRVLLCDRVKFRLRKPGSPIRAAKAVGLCCPICHAALAPIEDGVCCAAGHRFALGAAGVIDFTALASPNTHEASSPAVAPRYRRWRRLGRRAFLLGLTPLYGAFLLLMAPLGVIVGRFHQPLSPASSSRR